MKNIFGPHFNARNTYVSLSVKEFVLEFLSKVYVEQCEILSALKEKKFR